MYQKVIGTFVSFATGERREVERDSERDSERATTGLWCLLGDLEGSKPSQGWSGRCTWWRICLCSQGRWTKWTIWVGIDPFFRNFIGELHDLKSYGPFTLCRGRPSELWTAPTLAQRTGSLSISPQDPLLPGESRWSSTLLTKSMDWNSCFRDSIPRSIFSDPTCRLLYRTFQLWRPSSVGAVLVVMEEWPKPVERWKNVFFCCIPGFASWMNFIECV